MNSNNFSEKESLELISQMLRQTKQNLEVGSGNQFLYHGYTALVLSVVIFFLLHITGNPAWAALWFLMFLPSILIHFKTAHQKPAVVTYMEKAIHNTWAVIGSLFGLTVAALLLIGFLRGLIFDFGLMLPLSLIYCSIGTSITGVILKDRALTYLPLVAFLVAVYMLVALVARQDITPMWHLWFGLSFLFIMIIPGHLLNKKSESCSKN